MLFAKPIWWRSLVRCTVPLIVLAAGASMAGAQQTRQGQRVQRPHVAPRAGMNFESEDALLGLQLTAPIAGRWEFYPSADVFFPDAGSQYGFNGDVRYRMPTRGSLAVYGGTGLNVTSRHVGTINDTDLGVNLLGGLETRAGWVHPFVEGRVVLRDNTSFQALTGLSITLGR